jgi:hypothetical protein
MLQDYVSYTSVDRIVGTVAGGENVASYSAGDQYELTVHTAYGAETINIITHTDLEDLLGESFTFTRQGYNTIWQVRGL